MCEIITYQVLEHPFGNLKTVFDNLNVHLLYDVTIIIEHPVFSWHEYSLILAALAVICSIGSKRLSII